MVLPLLCHAKRTNALQKLVTMRDVRGFTAPDTCLEVLEKEPNLPFVAIYILLIICQYSQPTR